MYKNSTILNNQISDKKKKSWFEYGTGGSLVGGQDKAWQQVAVSQDKAWQELETKLQVSISI